MYARDRKADIVATIRRLGQMTPAQLWKELAANYDTGAGVLRDRTNLYNDIRDLVINQYLRRVSDGMYDLGGVPYPYPKGRNFVFTSHQQVTAQEPDAPAVIPDTPVWRLIDVMYWLSSMHGIEGAVLASRLTQEQIESAIGAVKTTLTENRSCRCHLTPNEPLTNNGSPNTTGASPGTCAGERVLTVHGTASTTSTPSSASTQTGTITN